jgi:hypothetical protein
MARSRRGRRGLRTIGDWETSDGVNIAGPPAISAAAKWGSNLGSGGAGLPVNTFFTHMFAAQKPLQQSAASLSVGAAIIAEVDAQFDLAGLNPAAVPPQQGFVVCGVGLYKGGFDRGANIFTVKDPLNGNDMTWDRWLVHRQGTFLLAAAQLISASTNPTGMRCQRIGFRYRKPIVVGQGENVSIGISILCPAGFVSLDGVSWIRWRYSKVW